MCAPDTTARADCLGPCDAGRGSIVGDADAERPPIGQCDRTAAGRRRAAGRPGLGRVQRRRRRGSSTRRDCRGGRRSRRCARRPVPRCRCSRRRRRCRRARASSGCRAAWPPAVVPWARAQAAGAASARTEAQPRPTSRAGCAWRPSTSARPTSSSARSSRRRGPVPRRAGRRVQAAARPGAARAVRRRPRASSRPTSARRSTTVFACVRPRRRSPRRRSPRCTRPACAPARRSWSRCSGRRSPRSSASDLAAHGVARAAPRRPHPGRRARQPAGARRAVRRDDRRGARLPARGREHARHRPRAAPSSASAGYVVPRPHPDARHPAGAGDGAARRASRSTTSTSCTPPASTPTRCCAPG